MVKAKMKTKKDFDKPSAVGQFIRNYRETEGLTLQQFGQKLGYTYGNFIGMIETGRAKFPVERWEEYAEVMGVKDKKKFLRMVLTELWPSMEPYL
jgi:hypothetical protein